MVSGDDMFANIKVRDVMTKDVAYATVPGSRHDVLQTLKSRHISGVPVVKDGRLVGIITRSDLLRNPTEEQLAILMVRDPITIGPEASIESAVRLMTSHGIRRLPVVERGELVGIITIADILGVIADNECDEGIEPYITYSVVSVWSETPLPVVGMIMELADVKAAPVLNSELELAGIVTDKDLITASMVEDTLHQADISAGSDEDAWTWESRRDTLKLYYSISRIKLPDKPVREAMRRAPVVGTNASTVSDVAKLMRRNSLEQIPVITGENRLKGAVQDRDIIKCVIKR
ncbi:MAG: CBS domain-containing protein [Methermicoccaceae archaeon]